jgi:hypothetical protein
MLIKQGFGRQAAYWLPCTAGSLHFSQRADLSPAMGVIVPLFFCSLRRQQPGIPAVLGPSAADNFL